MSSAPGASVEESDIESTSPSSEKVKKIVDIKTTGPAEEGAPNEFVKWDETLKKWIYVDKQTQVKYEWDQQRRAYMPLDDREYIKSQQGIYKPKVSSKITGPNAKKREREKIFEEIRQKEETKLRIPTSIIIKGLPKDISESEFLDISSKAGLIRKKAETKEPKFEIYRNQNGQCTGEGRVTYFRPESIDLAMIVIEGTEIRPGNFLTVERSEYREGDEENLEVKKKAKAAKLYDQTQELSWDEKEEVHVILKHCFDPAVVTSVTFFEELKEEIKTECEARCGKVQSIKIFERNPEGVVAIKFTRGYHAQKCIEIMNGRHFDNRQLTAEFYDGITDYHVRESEEDMRKRDEEWSKWLENENDEEPYEEEDNQ